MVPVTSLPPIELCHCMKFYKILFHPVVFMLCSKQEKVSKGNNSLISFIRVMVLVYCTSSHCALPLYEVLSNFIQ